jgi:hypothetical protein
MSMPSIPSVPGVVVRAELDRPRTWRGRWRGQDVDVVVLPVGAEPAIRRAALAAMQPLAGVAPGCLEVLACPDGIAVLGVAVSGRPVADLPPFDPSRAVALGVALAQAVSRLHARGLVWGAPYDDVVVDGRGSVGLPLQVMAERRLAGQRCSPRDDVVALVAMLRRRCPELDVDAPDMATLIKRLRRAARPRPLVLTDAAPLPARQGRLVVAALGAVAVVGIATVGWLSARPSSTHPDIEPARPVAAAAAPSVDAQIAPSSTVAPVDWRATVHALDRARAAGLAGVRPLTDADAASSRALAADSATAARLREVAPRTVPPVPELLAVTVLRADADDAVLRVTDTLSAYAYRDATGHTIAVAPARGSYTWTVTLASTAGGWRFASVSSAPSATRR